METELAYIDKRKRGGKWRYYFRKAGYERVRLPGKPGSPEFMAAYAAALNSKKPAPKPLATANDKTLNALIREYRQTHKYRKLKDSTKRETEYVLRKMEASNGPMPVAEIDTAAIERAMDSMTSGAANKWFRLMRPLMKLGKRRKYYTGDNPCEGVEMLKAKPYRPWTEAEHAQFEAFWKIGTRERLGYGLAYYTSQRRGDVHDMRWDEIKAGHMLVTPEKVIEGQEKEMWVPIHPELLPILAAVNPRYPDAILTTLDGKKMSKIHFGSLMADAIDAAGLPKECVLHGLRKSAAKAMADAGCNAFQIAAVTGHETTRMVEHYTKGRDRTKAAGAAILAWGKATKEKKKRTRAVNE